VEDVPTRGHFAHINSAGERFHADHALRRVELVDSFVTFPELDDWDELHVAINQRLMGCSSHHLSFLLSVLMPVSLIVNVLIVVGE